MSNQEQTLTITLGCPDCGGDGYHEVGPECSRPASSCCGGCYRSEGCKGCNETGEVELVINSESLIEMIEAVRDEDWDEVKEIINSTFASTTNYKTETNLV